ncbi:FadR/GntR family transcriptional regulator [Leucobacter luti]|uniref:GntR family transcriptional regulator n=1 Tax=Leucobacter luti TaxID=340320 RepID=A0A4Q7U8C1_9MICO|nr:FCD domain-containing protein [Leucobacter luti]MBL3701060.1 FadR family transcriptional regulator [Leucobacter luti]RZT68718.1 GntR family transcriptional regulator [Leucobacter luti]
MKTHEVVIAWVTGELASGRLSVGDRLPGERALAETLAVSRSSLREALRVLEALGTVTSATGSGPRAGTIISADPGQALGLALTLQLATSHVEYRDIYEVRVLLETWAAQHSEAARLDVTAAERLLLAMADPALSPREFIALDAEFHAVLAGSAANPLVGTLVDAMRRSIEDHATALAEAMPGWPALTARLRAEHATILEHLRRGDRAAAVALIRAHIEGFSRDSAAADPA